MSKENIGRLQELLERVQTRAAAPRATNGGAYVAPSEPTIERFGAPAAQITPPMGVQAATYDENPATEDGYDNDGDVEVTSEEVEVDIDIDEPMALESGAQPIANPTMPPEDLEEDVEEPMATQPSHRPPHLDGAQDLEEATQTNMAAPANEIEEPTPSSSRRPIAGEEPAAGAYEEESAPRHTPPPESGKQVAAPSAHPPASRKPSVPPPSLEGHTLIGGWREPGLGPQATPGGRGPTGTEPPATIQQGGAPQAAPARPAAQARLSADVTKPDLAAGGANVATFAGAAPVPKPTTMGELLDMTLGL